MASPFRASGIKHCDTDNTAYVTVYGAKGDGVADDTAAIQAALTAANQTNQTIGGNTTKGAIVYFPPGIYNFTQLDMSDFKNVVLVGAGAFNDGFPQGGSVLRCTATGSGTGIKMLSTKGCVIEGMAVTYVSGSYTGTLIDFGHSVAATDTTANRISHCFVGSYDSTVWSAACLLSMNKSIVCTVEYSTFAYAFAGIKFRLTNTDYSNANFVDTCLFHDFQTAAIMNAYNGIIVQKCTFENNYVRTSPFMAPAYTDNTTGGGSGCLTFTFANNWIGDGDGSTNIFDTGTPSFTLGLLMIGNYLTGKVRFGTGTINAKIVGNTLDGNGSTTGPALAFDVAGTYAMDFDSNLPFNTVTITNQPTSGVDFNNSVSWSGAFTIPNTITSPRNYSVAPAFKAGLTASGSAANDFSGSTGPFNTSSGTNTFNGSMSLVAGKVFDMATNSTMLIANTNASALGLGRTGIVVSLKGVTNMGQVAVTQLTSITTGVTANGGSGVITTVSASTAAGATSTFTVTSNGVIAASAVNVTLGAYSGTFGTNGTPIVTCSAVGAGSFAVTIYNAHASNALAGTLKINFSAT